MKKVFSKVKPYLRWLILGATFFFLLKTFKDHWQELASVSLDGRGWNLLAIAAIVTLLAHIWSGWVWTWILKSFEQPVKPGWAVRVYLMTNISKYLPGNVWHFYGRISAIRGVGGSLGVATVSVLLEPLLMAAAGLIIVMISTCLSWQQAQGNWWIWGLEILGLIIVLLGIHPLSLNPVIRLLNRSKGNTNDNVALIDYPLLPLLGEIGFLGLRGCGFLLALMALMPVSLIHIPHLFSVFSLAWLLGLIIPGAPGGLGVFEATAIAFIDKDIVSVGVILAVVALFRLVGLVTEAAAAGVAWLIGFFLREI